MSVFGPSLTCDALAPIVAIGCEADIRKGGEQGILSETDAVYGFGCEFHARA
jgi:hypothetical protein